MNTLLLIMSMGALMYTLRIAGLALHDVAVPQSWTRALSFVPVALLTALVVSSLLNRGDQTFPRVLAALGGALVAWRTRKMWACILSGMIVFWVVRLLS